jgi:HSP20 family molecular chaperone IbpA
MGRMIPSPFHGIFSSALTTTQHGVSGKDMKTSHGQQSARNGSHTSGEAKQSTAGQARPGTVGQVALDIFEYDNYYILKAPIAGVRLQDIDIEVNDSVITIRGTRRQSDDIPPDQYYLQECFWGEFERSVTLPCSIDARKVKATFNKESVLKILVPKEEKIKIIRIND